MGLTKERIGELVRLVDERNAEGINDFRGLDINKEFIHTKTNTAGLMDQNTRSFAQIGLF